MYHAPESHNVSVSKHLRGKKNGGWMRPPTWKLDFTHPSIRIDYTLPPQSAEATLRVADSAPTTKILKKS